MVNKIAGMIKMTRQGVRFHIHKLENDSKIMRINIIDKGNFLYKHNERGGRC
jgi:predicted ArsR family transcriptional regulator